MDACGYCLGDGLSRVGRLRDRAAYSGSYEASVRKAEAARALLAMLETKEVKGA